MPGILLTTKIIFNNLTRRYEGPEKLIQVWYFILHLCVPIPGISFLLLAFFPEIPHFKTCVFLTKKKNSTTYYCTQK